MVLYLVCDHKTGLVPKAPQRAFLPFPRTQFGILVNSSVDRKVTSYSEVFPA